MSKIFTQEELDKTLELAGGNISATARMLGVAKSTVQKAMGRHPDAKKAESPLPDNSVVKRSAGMDRSAFSARFDADTRMRNKIRSGLKRLTAGPDKIFEDAQFRVMCGCNTVGWRNVTAEDEFADYRFQKSGNYFWARPETVEWAVENIQGVAQ